VKNMVKKGRIKIKIEFGDKDFKRNLSEEG
jgi:hypothetical protein